MIVFSHSDMHIIGHNISEIEGGNGLVSSNSTNFILTVLDNLIY